MIRTVISVILMSVFVMLVVGCNLDNSNPSAPPPPIPPEISVRQDSTNLPDGSGEFVFNDVILIDGNGGYCTDNVVFTIENQGGENLSISGVALSAGDTEDFDLDTSSTANTVEPTYSTIFTICFDPLSNLGGRSAEVTISSNDADEGSYTFTVKGFGMKKCVASDGTADDLFGSSVAIDGDIVVVGANQYSDSAPWAMGAVYVFSRDQGGTDSWGEVKRLTASDGAQNDNFGDCVGISGDTVVVGSPGDYQNQGAAYVFYKDHGGVNNWGEFKKLTASDGAIWQGFGTSVAIDGDTVVVGSAADDIGSNDNQGSAYIFYRNHGGMDNWGEVKKLIIGEGEENDRFGISAAIDGDTVVVGGHGFNVQHTGQGAVYVFYRNQGGSDAWGQISRLTASDAAEKAYFGWSVDIDGDTVVVGSAQSSYSYVFQRNHGGTNNWGEVKKLTAGSSLMRDAAISGNTAAASSYMFNGAQGAVYLFSRNQGGTDNWGEVKQLTASDGASSDCLGSSVAVSGSTVVMGALGSNGDRGSAYIYEQ